MKSIFLSFVLLSFSIGVFAQKKKADPFRIVNVPDSLRLQLVKKTYPNSKDLTSKTGLYILNLTNSKDFIFKDGIYYYKGFGPHFSRRIFIFNKGVLCIFDNVGAFNPKGVLQEYLESIKKLDLTDKQTVKYLKAISEYLEQESGNTYGKEIK